jgi:hypothetical protein
MLAGMFISAVFEFGKVDAIGHSAIIVALLAFAADNATLQDKVRHPLWIEARQPWFAPVGLCLAIVGFLAIYYVSHTLLFGTSIV